MKRKHVPRRPRDPRSTQETGPSRLNTLKIRLDQIQRRSIEALKNGDLETNKWLTSEAAQLSAAITRAEALGAGVNQ